MEQETQQEFYLALTGKTSIEKPLRKDHKYSVVFKEIDIYAVNETSGQGDADKISFKGKSVSEVNIIDEGEIIFGQAKKTSQSQVLRRVLEQQYQEQWAGSDEYVDSESYYNKRMTEIIEAEREKLV